ncbi:uncharacterized protein LOC124847753 [Vigna umbellata]|uniref:uncharacterized protein LOC124847753 n=1 Tax=Vigna umbellata TaxID=87088 RepID=UPI001F5E7E31|nr:uncharacterized protein LOC124847753 [Vigna umbellata]
MGFPLSVVPPILLPSSTVANRCGRRHQVHANHHPSSSSSIISNASPSSLSTTTTVTNALPVRLHSSSSSAIVVTAKELRSTLLFALWHHRHHLLCSPNALDRRASHHRRRGTRLHHRASPPLSTPATIVILAGAQAFAIEERASPRRVCQVGEGRLLSLFLSRGKKTQAIFVVGFWILDMANNMLQGPYRALLADLSASDHRKMRNTNTFFSFFMAVGNVLGYAAGSYSGLHHVF